MRCENRVGGIFDFGTRRVQMAAGAEGRANMVSTQVTIGLLGGHRDVVHLLPELLSAHVAPLLEVAGAV